MLLLFAVAAAVPLHFHFHTPEFINAVYQTGCTTGRMNCPRDGLSQRSGREKG